MPVENLRMLTHLSTLDHVAMAEAAADFERMLAEQAGVVPEMTTEQWLEQLGG